MRVVCDKLRFCRSVSIVRKVILCLYWRCVVNSANFYVVLYRLRVQCKSKKYRISPKFFCNIFTRAKYISVKFCQFFASLHPHVITSFGRFILILLIAICCYFF